jgi:hypothetical protein
MRRHLVSVLSRFRAPVTLTCTELLTVRRISIRVKDKEQYYMASERIEKQDLDRFKSQLFCYATDAFF